MDYPNQWIYNLDTKAPPQMSIVGIGNCYRLDVYVDDGTVKISTGTYAIFRPIK